MSTRNPLTIGLALAAFALPAAAAAPEMAAPAWTVDHDASELGYAGVGNGEAFEGEFQTWTAKINFDPEALDRSSTEVTIDIASNLSDDPSRDQSLLEDDWFAAATFPEATFATTSIASKGGNAYEADGTLTIRGMSVPVTLPFTLDITGDTAVMKGSLTLDRTLWGLGKGSWQDKSVDPNVTVNVEVTAQRAG